MLKYHIFTLLVGLKSFFCPCTAEFNSKQKYTIKKVARLPQQVNESSGLIKATDTTFYTLNDGGGKTELYEINQKGALLTTKSISNTKNIDWEELTKDSLGNLYIGDFGNNSNQRRDLKIYKVTPTGNIDSILFQYPDQKQFPPPPQFQNFDCEAFFWHNDSLYLFSKNRKGQNVHFYQLPAKPGKYVATKVGEKNINGMITGAALSPNKKSFVLLSYGKIYFFSLNSNVSEAQPLTCRKFLRAGQAEAITYVNNDDLLITNEGGKIFYMKRK